MTLPASGTIKSSQIQTEFGGSNPILMSQYYGLDSGIPQSGPIKFSDFYGKVINATRTINATNNFNARTDFQNNATIVGGKRTSAAVYASNTAVKYYITVNGTIGATGTGSYAFDMGTFPAGTTIYLTNNSYIAGAGGAGGNRNSTAGGAGGPALILRNTTYITNNGTIAGGGGGGGAGGDGYSNGCQQVGCCDQRCYTATASGGGGGGGAGSTPGRGGSGGNPGATGTFFTGSAGGGGYCSSSGNQTACSQSGATGAALGSAAGAGANGSGSVGTAGGAAGKYITNSVYATWVKTGTRLGGAV
jgi:hypothetical protein